MRGRTPSPPRVLGMKHCITQLLCQGLYVQGNKQLLLLWATLGDYPLRRTGGITPPGLLNALQAFQQEVHPDGKVSLWEPKQHHPDHQHGQKAVEGMDLQFAVCPVIRRPPQPGPSAFADAEHRLRPGLAAVGFHDALRLKLLTVRKEDRLAKVAMFDLPLLAPIPLPAQIHHRPWAQLEGGHKEVLEPVVAHQLGYLAPDGPLGAGTVALYSLPDGRLQPQQLLFGLPLQQVQRTHLLAIEVGAEADQELALGASEFPLGPAVDLDPAAISQGQSLILLQRDLIEAAHPAGRDGRNEGEMGLLEGL